MFDPKKLMNAALAALPAGIVPEKGFAKSMAATLTLAVAADGVYERNEFEQACSFLQNHPDLRDAEMTGLALDYFRGYISYIEEAMRAQDHNFVMMRQELLEEIRKCPDSYNRKLRAVVTQLKQFTTASAERDMLTRIEAVL